MHRSDITAGNAGVASPVGPIAMTGIWRTIRDYILWSYERGTIQYDVMVTLILLFVFLAPHWINFKDKLAPLDPHRTQAVVEADGNGGLIFQIESSAVQSNSNSGDVQVRASLLHVIEPIAGDVDLSRYDPVYDSSGHVKAYKVWVKRR